MNTPMRQILHKLDLVGRMVAWVVELSKFGIIYKQRKTIKAHMLVEFVVEMTKPERE